MNIHSKTAGILESEWFPYLKTIKRFKDILDFSVKDHFFSFTVAASSCLINDSFAAAINMRATETSIIV